MKVKTALKVATLRVGMQHLMLQRANCEQLPFTNWQRRRPAT